MGVGLFQSQDGLGDIVQIIAVGRFPLAVSIFVGSLKDHLLRFERPAVVRLAILFPNRGPNRTDPDIRQRSQIYLCTLIQKLFFESPTPFIHYSGVSSI